jgi:hypothetical protein
MLGVDVTGFEVLGCESQNPRISKENVRIRASSFF